MDYILVQYNNCGRVFWLSVYEEIMMLALFILVQYHSVMDRRSDTLSVACYAAPLVLVVKLYH